MIRQIMTIIFPIAMVYCRYKGKIYIRTGGDIRTKLIQILHNSQEGSHLRMQNSIYKAKQQFYWPGMNQDIKIEALQCEVCQRYKGEHTPYLGLL